MCNYSIENLKKIVVDGTMIKSQLGNLVEIKRYPNNVIKIKGQLVSWAWLKEILIQGDDTLIVEEKEIDLFPVKHGGPRVAGPGKIMGRPKKKIKKNVKSFTLSDAACGHLSCVDCSKSQYVEKAILAYDRYKSNQESILFRMSYCNESEYLFLAGLIPVKYDELPWAINDAITKHRRS